MYRFIKGFGCSNWDSNEDWDERKINQITSVTLGDAVASHMIIGSFPRFKNLRKVKVFHTVQYRTFDDVALSLWSLTDVNYEDDDGSPYYDEDQAFEDFCNTPPLPALHHKVDSFSACVHYDVGSASHAAKHSIPPPLHITLRKYCRQVEELSTKSKEDKSNDNNKKGDEDEDEDKYDEYDEDDGDGEGEGNGSDTEDDEIDEEYY